MSNKKAFYGSVVFTLLLLILGAFPTDVLAFHLKFPNLLDDQAYVACHKKPCPDPGVEHLYLADSLRITDPTSILYKVQIDPATGHANLTALPDVGWGDGAVPYNWVHAIAVTKNNKKLYVIDQYTGWKRTGSGKMGVYDLENPSWTEIGLVTYNGEKLRGVVQAAFSLNDTLYIASGQTEKIYTVNLTNGVATLVGSVVNQATNAEVNIVGADMVFTADGTWYLYTSGANKTSPADAPQGLYKLRPPAVGGKIPADYIGMPNAESYTGLSIRSNGIGAFLSSVATTNECLEFGLNAALVDQYPMYKGGSLYKYKWGDMASPVGFCCRPMWWWKKYSWGGKKVTICGVVIGQTLGQKIMRNARSWRFSWLIAELIAAKLNTSNSSSIPVIDAAEAWLCAQNGIVVGGKLQWWKEFSGYTQYKQAKYHRYKLYYFNYKCTYYDN